MNRCEGNRLIVQLTFEFCSHHVGIALDVVGQCIKPVLCPFTQTHIGNSSGLSVLGKNHVIQLITAPPSHVNIEFTGVSSCYSATTPWQYCRCHTAKRLFVCLCR